ncbi:MAG: 3-isopropylmalate dehydratase large subunit [Candidatus Verstraetearchaeota archaeon]|nr:3-isopropylmalate dehydratase large subunit [Candidatus Verstraetearchaeota archaeon]
MGMTLVEKIIFNKIRRIPSPGEIVVLTIDAAMAHDGTAPLMIKSFEEMGAKKVWDNEKAIFVVDHISPSSNEGTSILHKMMRDFAKKHGIKIYDVGEGICHQILPEKGYVFPGGVVVGADSHTCTHGAFAAFATGIGSTEMAAVFASGKLWFKVPESIKININGKMKENVMSKDIILYIIGELKADGATYKAVEFTGNTVKEMSMESRMVMTNMVVEMGGKTGLIASDEKTRAFLEGRIKVPFKEIRADEDAIYSDEFEIEAEKIEPMVSCPHSVDNVKPVSEVEGIEVDQVFIGSCTNGRLEDLEIVARILKGKKVKARTIIMPASREVLLNALKKGIIEDLVMAGCALGVPGCGPCVGGHHGIPSPGEVVVSTTNRNFKGRMGIADAYIYLASPITAAYAAVNGKITYPKVGE